MDLGFEKAFLLQNSINLEYSEIISTYVYKIGIQMDSLAIQQQLACLTMLLTCCC